MSALASLIRRIPRSGASALPPDPPLLDDATFARLLAEVAPDRTGLPWRLMGGLPAALGARLADGECREEAPLLDHLALADGEAADAFSGRVAGPPGRTPSERLLQRVAWARATSEVLHACHIEGSARALVFLSGAGRTRAQALPTGAGAPHIGILDGKRLWIAESPANRSLVELAMDVGWALSLRKFSEIGPEGVGLAEIPAVVALDRRAIRDARHVHRTAGLVGPWLGVAVGNRTHSAPPLELVCASRQVVDVPELAGLMRRIHILADALLDALPDDAPQLVARDLTRLYGDLWRPTKSWQWPPRTEGREEYVAFSITPERGEQPLAVGRAELAWALGVEMHRLMAREGRKSASSPSIKVPLVVRGERRAVLIAVRFDGERPEPRASFAARLDALIAAEGRGYGLLTEWQRRIARQPLADLARRTLVQTLRSATQVDGPAATLAGFGEVTFSDLPPRREADWPVYSGATPPGGDGSASIGLHVHRIGDAVHFVTAARGAFAERTGARDFGERVAEALRGD